MKLNQKNWSCPKKTTARQETIINQYREHYGYSLPIDAQYWSMAGQCATSDGSPLIGCELDQVVSSGLITETQFYGVEIEKDIYDLNRQAYPNSNWYNDDFLNAMICNSNFNPGIVNADLIQTPETGSLYIAKCMDFLSQFINDIMFVANFIIQMRHYDLKDGNYVIESLNKQPLFVHAMTHGSWVFDNKFYKYNGTGSEKSKIAMGTFIFRKHRQDT